MNYDIYDTQHEVEIGTNKIAIDFGNPAGTARELQGQLNDLKEKYEVKLWEAPASQTTTKYKARPGTSSHEITVSPVEEESGTQFTGFKHEVANKNVNRITIYGQVTNGILQTDIERFSFQDNGGVFVYFPLNGNSPDLEKPLLICLSETGAAASSPDNRWYKRQGANPPYTWSIDRTFDSKHDPNQINTLKSQLQVIQSELPNATKDKGYPKPTSPDLPTIDTTPGNAAATNVEIDIGETGDYQSDSTSAGGENVKVLTFSVNPKTGFTRYTHYVQGTAGKYKRITSGVSYKNGQKAITLGAKTNVHYVYVYFGKVQGTETPLLICVATGAGTIPDKWTYYSNETPGQPNNTSWSEVTELTGDPDGTGKSAFLAKLDKLNDKANQQTFIHIEKTDEEGVISSGSGKKIYKTGSDGNTTITVSKTEGDNNSGVPEHYVRYTHELEDKTKTTTFTLHSVKHNGQEMNGIVPTGSQTPDVTAVYVYYKKTDIDHEFPLIVCIKTPSTTTTYNYHKRGNQWTSVGGKLDKVDPDDQDPKKEVPNKGIDKLFKMKKIAVTATKQNEGDNPEDTGHTDALSSIHRLYWI